MSASPPETLGEALLLTTPARESLFNNGVLGRIKRRRRERITAPTSIRTQATIIQTIICTINQ